MRWLFSGRNAKLETMNRILTDAARKRTERIEELERRGAQLERELETAREAIERARQETGLPADDVVRYGPDALYAAIAPQLAHKGAPCGG